jgi:hypothetical protein
MVAVQQFKRGSHLVKSRINARQTREEGQGNWEKAMLVKGCE